MDVTARNKENLLLRRRVDLLVLFAELNKNTDPNTVLESAYGKQFIATLDRVAQDNPDNILTEVKQTNPELLQNSLILIVN